MFAFTELNVEQRRFVRALFAVGGSGSTREIADRLGITAEAALGLLHDLPAGWAQALTQDALALTSAGRAAARREIGE